MVRRSRSSPSDAASQLLNRPVVKVSVSGEGLPGRGRGAMPEFARIGDGLQLGEEIEVQGLFSS